MSKEEAIEKIADYIRAESAASLKDYELLTKINRTTTDSIKDYNSVAEKIANNICRINQNQMARARMDKLVQNIEAMEAKVDSLELLAYKLDSYSQRLESTYMKLNQEG